jgi:ABC-type Fe3+ transport system permease subunit
MPFCKKCGKSFRGKARFCPKCGALLGTDSKKLSDRERMKIDLELKSLSRYRKGGIAVVVLGFMFPLFGTIYYSLNVHDAVQLGLESELSNFFWTTMISGVIIVILGVILWGYTEYKDDKIREAL